MPSKNNQVSGWVGWAVFAGVLMVISGVFQAIVAFAAIMKDTVYIVGDANILSIDYTTWGWLHMAIALLILLAGLSVLKGHMYGRIVGVTFALISAIINMLWIPATPIWSILIIAVDVCIIYALVVHGKDLKVE